jgi:branched-chain amino acid transport system substrate-binding protein
MITDLTGPGASTYSEAVKGVEARLDLQNAEGGVDGRQLKLFTADDAGSPSQAATAAEELVAQHHPLVMIADSDVTFGAAKYLHSIGEPVFGDGLDSSEWGTQPYTNMFAPEGDVNPATQNGDNTVLAQFFKNEGATNVAIITYGEFPTAVAGAKSFAVAAKSVGMKVGLLDDSVPFPGMNATSIALAMNDAHVDAMEPGLQTSDSLSLLVAVHQTGQHLKVPFLGTGYGQDFLSDPSAVQAGQGAYFEAWQIPISEKTPATVTEVAALQKYSGFTGVPPINLSLGWENADLAITGLEAAGPNPSQSAIISAVRNKVTNWTAGGLFALPRDFSLAHFGQSPERQCDYFVQLEGKTYVPVPASGAPVCGTKTD